MLELIQAALAGMDAFVCKEDPLTLADSEPEPDLAVIDGKIKDYDYIRVTTARLVIEVSVSSLALDRAKAAIYAAAGIPEYWIVLAEFLFL